MYACILYLFLFFIFLTSLLEYNCFTMVCQFLLYNKVNQLHIHMSPYLFPLASPSLPPSLSHPSRLSQSTELISLCYVAASHQLSILCLVVYICPCHSLTLSQLTLPPFPVSSSPSSSRSASLFPSCPQVLHNILFFFLFSFFQIPYKCVSIRYLFFSF